MQDISGPCTFSSKRDEVLYRLARAGCADGSGGTAKAATGWFACMVVHPQDIARIEANLAMADIDATGVVPSDLVGAWRITEDESNVVTVLDTPAGGMGSGPDRARVWCCHMLREFAATSLVFSQPPPAATSWG